MSVIETFRFEFARYSMLAEGAIASLADEAFFAQPGRAANSIALIAKHLSGNLRSRWTDFLTSDGEKPTRDRDAEFALGPADTREKLLADWQQAWTVVADTLGRLTDADLTRVVTIRGEAHSVLQATLRSVNHVAYHTGQILLLARTLRPDAPWLTIAPGKSREHRAGSYLGRP